jgi:hypothetical protein
MNPQTANFRNFTSYRLKEAVEQTGKSPYEIGIYTHASGRDALVTTYDYKKKDAAYHDLRHDAAMLMIIAEKQEKRRNVNATVPAMFSIIDKANRLVVIREFVNGILLKKVTQGVKVNAYLESVKELEKLSAQLTPEETGVIPRLTRAQMNKSFFKSAVRAFIGRRRDADHLLKLMYMYYRYAVHTNDKPVLAHRALTADRIVCGTDQVFMSNFRRSVLTAPGTDEALFPQLYYSEVGPETMRKYLDETFDTRLKKYRFLHLAAFYVLYFEDFRFVPVLADSIIPYITESLRKNPRHARSISLAVETPQS